MNKLAGTKAYLYGKLMEQRILTKLNLLKINNKADGIKSFGDLFGMSEEYVEIKSLQFLSKNGFGEIKINDENHKKLKERKGYYVVVFNDRDKILFIIVFQAYKLDKFFGINKGYVRGKSKYHRVSAKFYKKIEYVLI